MPAGKIWWDEGMELFSKKTNAQFLTVRANPHHFEKSKGILCILTGNEEICFKVIFKHIGGSPSCKGIREGGASPQNLANCTSN